MYQTKTIRVSFFLILQVAASFCQYEVQKEKKVGQNSEKRKCLWKRIQEKLLEQWMLLFSWKEYSRLYLLMAVSKKISWEAYMVQLDQNLTLKLQ